MGVRDYDLQTQLGKGSQGVVWKAKRKADGVLVAIKQIMLRSMSRREQADAAQEVRARGAANRDPCRHPVGGCAALSHRCVRGLGRVQLLEGAAAGACVLCGRAVAFGGGGGAGGGVRGRAMRPGCAYERTPSLRGCARRSGCWRG